MAEALNREEQKFLLRIAREAIENSVKGETLPKIELARLPERLREKRASFVTLTLQNRLRGCIGTLDAYQSLAEDVQEHAVAAALMDPRFTPVQQTELSEIRVEVSALTPKTPLSYETPDDLPRALTPGVDGVVLQDGSRKATFLPQVWEQLPDPEQFLSHLCMKMGAPPDLWRKKQLQVSLYQVESFSE